MGTKFKRSRLWVDSGFQFRLLLRVGIYFLLYTLIIMHIGFVFEVMADLVSNGVRMGFGAHYLEFFGRQRFLLLTLALGMPILLYDLLKFSHRIAGPLYRCRNVMHKMAGGQTVPEFKPRKHDLLRELFQAFNALIKEWNSRVRSANGHPREESPAGMRALETSPTPESSVVAAP